MKTYQISEELLETLLDNTYELEGERRWWKDEPRCSYQEDHQEYLDTIKEVEEILGLKATDWGDIYKGSGR